jgi:hypothetical protein
MTTSGFEPRPVKVTGVKVTKAALELDLDDGRTVSVPLGWYPRLAHGTTAERAKWCLIGGGTGIHWPDLDEDISVEGLLAGHPSGESQTSFQRWLAERSAGRPSKRLQRPSAGTRRTHSRAPSKAAGSRRGGARR